MPGDSGNPEGWEFPDDDVGESTITMDAPPFDPSIPLPISNPPPPPEVEAPPPKPVQVPRTAPVPFLPTKSGPASTPQLARPKVPSSPMVPTPLGGITPVSVPSSAKTPPAPASQPKVAPATPPKVEPKTAGAGVAGMPGAREFRATRIGLAPPPSGGISAARPGAAAPRPPPAEEDTGLRTSNTPAIAVAPAPPPDGGLDPAKLFDLDAGAAEAARAAVASPGRPGPASSRSEKIQQKPAASHEILKVSDEADDDEAATRAVSREDYFRKQDAHVVVGNDAVGDDATLAVGPEDNEARSQRLVPFAQTMLSPDGQGGAFPPPPTFPHAPPPAMPTSQPHPGAGPGWNEPQMPWSPAQSGSTSSPMHLAAAPMVPGSNPQMPGPMQGYPQGPYAGQPRPAAAVTNPGGTNKLPKQFIVLAVVGVVCVTIFITGIVLFATTKF